MCMNESGTEILYSYGEHSFVLWDIQKGLVVCDILCVKIKNDLQIHENSLTDDKVRLIQNINDHLYVFSTDTYLLIYDTNKNAYKSILWKYEDYSQCILTSTRQRSLHCIITKNQSVFFLLV